MIKKQLLAKLELISNELETIPGDSSLLTAVKDIGKVRGYVDELIIQIEESSDEAIED